MKTLKAEVALATIVGGPSHGAVKMTGDRSPPQFCSSLFWLGSSSTAAPTFRSSLFSLITG